MNDDTMEQDQNLVPDTAVPGNSEIKEATVGVDNLKVKVTPRKRFLISKPKHSKSKAHTMLHNLRLERRLHLAERNMTLAQIRRGFRALNIAEARTDADNRRLMAAHLKRARKRLIRFLGKFVTQAEMEAGHGFVRHPS